jgi:hypothetical protein
MDLKELENYLKSLTESLRDEDKQVLNARLKSLISVFPFNQYEYVLMFLLHREVITFDDYERLRNDYVSSNKYLELYGIAPRIFGEIWAQEHFRGLDSRFLKPGKQLDPSYVGQYDLWIENVRVEVKAARAINTKKRGDLVSKALRYDSSDPFWMNFQQIKLDAADVFIFIGVWVDQIVYWVLSNEEVKRNKALSHQHRGGIEYQIGITHKNIRDFDIYKVNPLEVAEKVLAKSRKRRKK